MNTDQPQQEEFNNLEEIDLNSESQENQAPQITSEHNSSIESQKAAENNVFSEFHNYTRGEDGFVIISSKKNENAKPFWIYLIRYVVSLGLIFGLASVLMIVYFAKSTSSSSTEMNLIRVGYFGIKLNYVGLFNGALVSATIVPLVFGIAPSAVVVALSIPVFSVPPFLLFLVAKTYRPMMMVPGFYIQIIFTIGFSFVYRWVTGACAKVFRRGRSEETTRRPHDVIQVQNNDIPVQKENYPTNEANEKPKEVDLNEVSPARQQAEDQTSQVQYDSHRVQLRASEVSQTQNELSPEKTQELLTKWERELLLKNRRGKNFFIVCLSVLCLFSQLIVDIAWVSAVPTTSLPVVYCVLIPLYPVVNWMIQKFVKHLMENKLSDKLLIDFISIMFSTYCWKLMIVYFNDWPLFIVYQLFEMMYKCSVYFLWLPRPIYGVIDAINIYSRFVLRRISFLQLIGIKVYKIDKSGFDERYSRFVRDRSRKYYLLSFVEVHATLQLLLIFAIRGVAIPFFFVIPWFVGRATMSDFNPCATGQVYISGNIMKWFLAVCVASLGSLLALQNHKLLPYPWTNVLSRNGTIGAHQLNDMDSFDFISGPI